MKKRVLALCGAGLASSSAMSEVIYDFCHREHIDVSIDKASLLDLRGDPCCETINRYDLVVSVTKVPAAVKVKVIHGIELLTGYGIEETLEEIRKYLQDA